MTASEWKQAVPEVFVRIHDVRTQAELKDFVAKILEFNDMGFDKPQYKWYFIEEFGDNESALVLKMHHSMMDGQS